MMQARMLVLHNQIFILEIYIYMRNFLFFLHHFYCNVIIRYKPTKGTFHKLVFNFLKFFNFVIF
jgi:hypothetical protein